MIIAALVAIKKALILGFFFFFLVVTKKVLNSEKDNFDQRTACQEPIHWLKYTTTGPQTQHVIIIV